MGTTLPKSAARTHVNSLHSDLQSIRAGSSNLRISVNPAVSREAARHAMAVTGLDQKSFAINAKISEPVFSDALNQRGRHFEIEWVLAQPPAYMSAFFGFISTRLGLTSESRASAFADEISRILNLHTELVKRLIERMGS